MVGLGQPVLDVVLIADAVEDVPGGTATGTESGTRAVTQELDAAKLAQELMRGAGYDPADLERIEPLLKDAARHDAIRKQLTVSAPAPKWKR